jgi:hypothetical protein
MNFSYYFFKLITITHENVQPLQKQLSLNAFTLVLHTFYFIFISLADHIISVYHFFSSILYFNLFQIQISTQDIKHFITKIYSNDEMYHASFLWFIIFKLFNGIFHIGPGIHQRFPYQAQDISLFISRYSETCQN